MIILRIAVSGLSGCGATTVVKLVSEKLGLVWINYTCRDIAKELGKDFEEFQFNDVVREFPKYDLMLDEMQVSLVSKNENCIIGSRLACWLDSERLLSRLGMKKMFGFDLKVWLEASPEERARRIVQREGKGFEKTLSDLRKRDSLNITRYKELYGIDVLKHSLNEGISLVINTDKLDASQVSEAICREARNE